jgi:hypothetical protein
MSITIFSDGTAGYRKNADGVDVFRIEFSADKPRTLQRHELPAGTRLETNGAIAESFGRGGSVLEIISLDELQARFSDEKIVSEASGSCRLGTDDHGITRCDQGTCSGGCTLKQIVFWTWCSCG